MPRISSLIYKINDNVDIAMNISQLDATVRLRRKVLIGMCSNLGLAALLLGLGNLFYFDVRSVPLGVMELGYFVVSGAMLIYIRGNRAPQWFLAFHSFVLAFLVVFGTFTKEAEEILFIWAIAMPTVFYLALGKHIGFYWSLLFLFCELVAIFDVINGSELTIKAVSANFVLAYVCVWVVSHAYETSRVKGIEDLHELAMHDALTGVRNRLALYASVAKNKHQAKHGQYVLTLDIDDFKKFNDKYGHDAGDAVLIEVASRLVDIAGEANTYRVGGEEFIIILGQRVTNESQIKQAVEQLHRSVQDSPVIHQERKLNVTFSAGLVEYASGAGFEDVIAQADSGLYQAKAFGKACTFYNGEFFVE